MVMPYLGTIMPISGNVEGTTLERIPMLRTALHNIAIDLQGNIYSSEVNTGQRFQKFRRLDLQN
jgi:hypothetical protein